MRRTKICHLEINTKIKWIGMTWVCHISGVCSLTFPPLFLSKLFLRHWNNFLSSFQMINRFRNRNCRWDWQRWLKSWRAFGLLISREWKIISVTFVPWISWLNNYDMWNRRLYWLQSGEIKLMICSKGNFKVALASYFKVIFIQI